MIQTTSTTLLDRSRLEGLLIELANAKSSSLEYNLAERLGYMMGVSGSLNLARSLKQLPSNISGQEVEPYSKVEQEVLSACRQMMLAITTSFVAQIDSDPESDSGEVQLKVPSAVGLRLKALQTFDPYQRFYVAQQTEMAMGLQKLRYRIRKSLSGMSVELNQLAELDQAMDDNLAAHTRKLFNVIPKLLEQRFKFLLAQHNKKADEEKNADELAQWLEPNGWLALFYQDMREMLLAEFDVRLQPILGLLEALNEQKDTLS